MAILNYSREQWFCFLIVYCNLPPLPLTSPYNETTPDSIFLNEVPVINVNQIVLFLVILF